MALVLLCSVQMMLNLDDTVVNVALPTLQRTLGLSEGGLTWIVNAYLLTFGGFLLLGGRCADLFGPRRVFLIGVAIFGIASLMTGSAQNSAMIIASRAGQGIGGAAAGPAALAMVAGLFSDPRARSRTLGIWAGLGGFAATLGVVLSGLLTEYMSWRWCFLINVPVAVAALVAVPRLVPARRPVAGPRRVDGIGAALVTGAAAMLALGFIDAGRVGPVTIALRIGTGVVLLIAFAVVESRHTAPLIPLSFFRNRDRAVANLANIALCSTNVSMLFFLTLYLQQVLHLGPARTGAAWLPFCATVILGFATAAWSVPRVGVRVILMAALGTGSIGMFLLSRLSYTGDFPALLPGLLVAGLGMGLGFVAMTIAAVGETHDDITGLASGLVATTQQLGGAIGLGALGAVASHRSAQLVRTGFRPEFALTEGFRVAFLICAALAAAATVLVGIGITRNAGIVELPDHSDATAPAVG
ncbi:MFS transporter [Nocardia sp. alder85J]|uniref:MFS transporter n=1 Tax=Nocardia sp. alder85J TaxID=2862949 RepID=UPI001CD3DBDC|nr:MFS transporter [Nocardia sp. alder85J]MCX4094442.1 MFS transporter [Nocardia sp. alder85J]